MIYFVVTFILIMRPIIAVFFNVYPLMNFSSFIQKEESFHCKQNNTRDLNSQFLENIGRSSFKVNQFD